jgi:hypothetical protein
MILSGRLHLKQPNRKQRGLLTGRVTTGTLKSNSHPRSPRAYADPDFPRGGRMRVTCPACRAPFTVANELADQPGRCPNCERELVPSAHPWRKPAPQPGTGTDGRSKALTLAALLHFVYVLVGSCMAAGLAEVVQKFASNRVHGMQTVGFLLGTVLVAAVSGIGLLARWKNAGYTALIVSAYFIFAGFLGFADGNLIGGCFWLAVGGYIGAVVWVRWDELK